MQDDPNFNSAAPLSLDTLISRVEIPKTDKAAMTKATETITAHLQLLHDFKPNDRGGPSPLHERRIREAEAALSKEPTEENATKLHDLIILADDANKSYPNIDRAVNVALRWEIDSLQEIALRIIDTVKADAEAEGASLLKQLEAGDSVFGFSAETSLFKSRLQRTLTLIENERKTILSDGAALHWLASRGFCENPYQKPLK